MYMYDVRTNIYIYISVYVCNSLCLDLCIMYAHICGGEGWGVVVRGWGVVVRGWGVGYSKQ